MPRVLNAGDNGDISEKVFFDTIRELEDLAKRKAKLASDEKAVWKQAKDDGLDKDDLKTVMRRRALSTSEQVASHNRQTLYMRYLKLPIAEKIETIDEKFSDETGLTDEQRQTKWENVGYVAGMEGKGLDVAMEGHDPNGMTGRYIREGWEKGQKELGSKIKRKAPEPAKASPAPETATPEPVAETAQNETPPAPSDISEAPKRRGRPPKGGLTYWHKPDTRQVFEVSVADAQPAGAESITRKEFEKLSAEYASAEESEWASSAPVVDTPPAPEADDDGWSSPPAPDL